MSPDKFQHIGEHIARTSSKATGFVFESEEDRLLKDLLRPDIEKLQLFTKMIRRNVMLTHLSS